ncbi:MAG: hypothetical protein ACOCP8_05105 [archaeon]
MLSSPEAEQEIMENFMANSEFQWIAPEEIDALTDAPIIGVRDENDNVIEAYGFMDYQIHNIAQAFDENPDNSIELLEG